MKTGRMNCMARSIVKLPRKASYIRVSSFGALLGGIVGACVLGLITAYWIALNVFLFAGESNSMLAFPDFISPIFYFFVYFPLYVLPSALVGFITGTIVFVTRSALSARKRSRNAGFPHFN